MARSRLAGSELDTYGCVCVDRTIEVIVNYMTLLRYLSRPVDMKVWDRNERPCAWYRGIICFLKTGGI